MRWFQSKCQDADDMHESGDYDEDDDEAEYDSILIESAGELLPSLVTIIGGDNFKPHFQEFIKELTKKSVSTAFACSLDGSLCQVHLPLEPKY